MDYIPYGRQSISEVDIQAVVEVLRSDFLTQGPVVPSFEKAVAQKVGAQHGVAVNSATSALHVACFALGLGKGDWLWTVPNTFVASANCALYCGATVELIDIDINNYNLSIDHLKKKLAKAKKENKLPKILIAVHLAGQSCNMKEISKLSKKYNFKVIEDASHAIGGKYKNSFIGSCKYSDITIFSFHPVKIITTGEGGMALTGNKQIHKKIQMLISHGITKNKKNFKNKLEGDWYYEQIDLGFNYRMNDIQASLGISQLSRINKNIKRRHEIADIYFRELKNLPIILPQQDSDAYSSFHLFIIRVQIKNVHLSHKQIFKSLRKKGINTAEKKSSRSASDGLITVVVSKEKGVILEINSETDFAAKDSQFKDFAIEVANYLSNNQVNDINDLSSEFEEKRQSLIQSIGENIQLRRLQTLEVPSGGCVGAYVHSDGRLAALVSINTDNKELAKDLAMHVSATNPSCLQSEDIDPELLEREKAIFLAQAEESGKDASIMEKMVEGKVKRFLSEVTLVSQGFGGLATQKTIIFLWFFKVSVASGRLGNQKTLVFQRHLVH
mgnify:CR=1 FL=1